MLICGKAATTSDVDPWISSAPNVQSSTKCAEGQVDNRCCSAPFSLPRRRLTENASAEYFEQPRVWDGPDVSIHSFCDQITHGEPVQWIPNDLEAG